MTWKYRGYLVVVGCFLTHLSLGALYSDGNFGPYLVSYMRDKGESVTSTYVVWIQSVQMAAEGILMIPAGFMERKFGCRLVAIVGCILMSVGTAVSYWTCSASVGAITMTFGIVYGIGTGIAYIAALIGGMKWFPEHRGMVNGIVVAGFGLGASIIDPIQTAYVNPNNYSPINGGYFMQPDLLSKVPTCFLLMAGVYAGIQIIGCILMAPIPKEKMLEELEKQKIAITDDTPQGFSPKEVLRFKEFYMMWSTLFLNGMIVTFYTSMYKVYGQTFIRDDHFFTLIGTFTSIANAVARLCWGTLVDKISYKTAMTMISCLCAFFLFTMPLTKHGGKAMYTVWTLCMYLSMSGTFAVCPTGFSKTFGPKHMSANYSMTLTNNLICPIVTAAITQVLIDKLGYDILFLVLGGVMCCTVAVTYFYDEYHFRKAVENYKLSKANNIETKEVATISTPNLDMEDTINYENDIDQENNQINNYSTGSEKDSCEKNSLKY